MLTADHGCDPTWPGNDHTREYVPVIAYHHNIGSISLGERPTFADLGQTVADIFDLEEMNYGTSGYGPSIYIHDPDGNKVELKGLVNGA